VKRVIIFFNFEPARSYNMAFTPLHDRVLVERVEG